MTTVENKEIEKNIIELKEKSLLIKVADNDSYLQAGEMLAMVKDVEKKIEAWFEPHVKKANELHKSLTAARAAEIAKLQPIKQHLNNEIVAYHKEQEQIRLAEQERLRKEAEKAEEERRLMDAILAEQAGEIAEAEAILNEPVIVPPPIVEQSVPKIAGQTIATTWKHKVTDLHALCRAVVSGKAPIACIQPNDVFLGQQARAGKGLIKYDGVEFYPEKSVKGVRK